jgi:hypothetical protein
LIIKINGWDKYQQRTSGYKRPWWFSFSNTFLEDDDIWHLSDSEKIAFIYLLCQASKKQKDQFSINFQHASRSANVEESTLKAAIKKLEQLQVVVRICTDSDQDLAGIRPVQDKTRQDNTRQYNTPKGVSPTRTHWLVEIWNESSGKLPKVRLPISQARLKNIQARVRQSNQRDDWREAIEKLSQSDFCNGKNDRSWVANFDFLLKPNTLSKALEGNYDNRRSMSQNQHTAEILRQRRINEQKPGR